MFHSPSDAAPHFLCRFVDVIRSLYTPLVQQSTIKVSRISREVVILHSFLKQKHAIWSLCVACIICSALTVYIYTTHGLLIIQQFALTVNYRLGSTREDARLFVAELQGDKMVYTEKKKTALAFFAFVIICSVIEIVLAAAMMKICKTPRLSSSGSGYYQVLFPHCLPCCIVPSKSPGVTHLSFSSRCTYCLRGRLSLLLLSRLVSSVCTLQLFFTCQQTTLPFG